MNSIAKAWMFKIQEEFEEMGKEVEDVDEIELIWSYKDGGSGCNTWRVEELEADED